MKKLTIKRVILLACIVCGMQTIQAECYVLDDPTTVTLYGVSGATKTYNVNGPAAVLTFEASKYWMGVSTNFTVYQTVNGVETKVGQTGELNKDFQAYTMNLNVNATQIKFKSAGSLNNYIRNVKVTRAKLITSSSSQLVFNTLKVEQEQEKTTTITYSNVGNATLQLNANTSGYFSITQGGHKEQFAVPHKR